MPTQAQLKRERDIRNGTTRTKEELKELKRRNKEFEKEQNEKIRCGECEKLNKRKNMEYKFIKGKGNYLVCKNHVYRGAIPYPQNILAF